MSRLLRVFPAVLALCVASALAAGAAHAAGSANTCFTPAELAARPGERNPVKGNRAFDRSDAPFNLAPIEPVPDNLRGAIRRVELPKGSRKLIALTFDLCEQPGEIAGYDGAVFDYLRANGIKATFFSGGKWIRSHDERARQILTDPLFEFANHSWSHRNLRLLQGADLKLEIEGPQRAYEALRAKVATSQCVARSPDLLSAMPPRMRLFRFPFGACNAESLKAVNDAGLIAIQWDLPTGDPSPTQTAVTIAGVMVRQAKPGAIVINHANGRGYHTAEALPLAIPKLKAAGYEFVTVSELIAAGKPVIEQRCYDTHPGDTDRYDAWFRKPAAATAAAPQTAQKKPKPAWSPAIQQ